MIRRSTRHPFTRALYELQADNTILVTDGDKQGLFDAAGRWLSGALRECDPQLCVWVGNNPELQQKVADSHMAQLST